MLFVFFIAVIVVIHPDLNRGGRIIIGVGVLHPEGEAGAGHSAVGVGAIRYVIGFAGPGQGRALGYILIWGSILRYGIVVGMAVATEVA